MSTVLIVVFFCFFYVYCKNKLYATGSTFSHLLFRDFASDSSSQDYSFEFKNENGGGCYNGIKSLLSNENFQLIATEIDFTREEKIYTSNLTGSIEDVMCLPSAISSLVFVFKLPEVSKSQILTLKHAFSLGIFNRTYRIWNTKDLRDKNMFLPDKPIKTIFRDDLSGTTYILSKFFSSYSKKFRSMYGIHGDVRWNISHPTGHIKSQIDVIDYVNENEFSVGYIAFSSFKESRHGYQDIRVARFLTEDGDNSIFPDKTSMENALKNSGLNNLTFADDDYELPRSMSLFNVPGDNVWPYCTMSYLCLIKNQTKDSAEILYRFFSNFYDFTSNDMISTSFVSIPKSLQQQALKILRHGLLCDGEPCFKEPVMSRIVVQIATIVLFCFGFYGLCIILTGFLTRRKFSISISPSSHKSQSVNVIPPSQVSLRDLVLEEQIGSGSFSEVYRGRWLGTEVAIKRFLVSKTNKSVFEEFRMETALLKNLRHPNIVQFLSSMITETHLYIICEYCERGNLQTVLRNSDVKLSIRKIVSFALDAAKGMEYLHSYQPPILHRDFKSSNLLMSKDWTVKIGDFGLSRILSKREEMSTCGTVETCAPEVLSCKPYTEKADVYSFGIVLFEMLTREELYPDMNFFAISKKVVEERYRPNIDEIPDSCSYDAEIKELVQCCWAHNPSERPTFGKIVKRLSKIFFKLDREAREKSSVKRTPSKMIIADSFEKISLLDRFEDQMMGDNGSMMDHHESFFRSVTSDPNPPPVPSRGAVIEKIEDDRTLQLSTTFSSDDEEEHTDDDDEEKEV